MFIKKSLIQVTTIVILSIAALSFGNKIKADRFSIIFDQQTRVAANVTSSHNIYFSSVHGVSAAGTIVINFPSAFAFGSLYDFNDVTLAEGSNVDCTISTFTLKTVGSTASGSTWGVSKSGSTTITFTSGTDTITANRCVRIVLNSNGTNHTIFNPNVTTNTVYNQTITTALDTGEFALIILGDATASNVDQISVNAKVSTSILMGVDTVLNDCNNNTQTTPINQIVNFGALYPNIAVISGSTIPFVCIEAGTNSVNGFRILAQSSRVNSAGGLVSGSDVIPSATANLNVVSSGYGLRVASTGTPTLGSFTASSPYNSATPGSVGQINGTLGIATQLITSTAAVRSGSSSRIAIELGAKADTSIPASSSYADTLTFTAFTNL